MKLGFGLRIIWTDILNIIRKFVSRFIYVLWLLFDPGKFKKINNKEIRSILVIYSGAIGDRYNALGIMNKLLIKYNYLKLYFLTSKKEASSVKNPKIRVVNLDETKRLIDNKRIDAMVVFADTYNAELFDWDFYIKTLKVPYRVGLSISSISSFFKVIPYSYTRRIYPNEKVAMGDHILAFEKLGFKFNKEIEFYFTQDAEEHAKKFLKQHKIKKNERVIFMHPTSKKTAECIKEKKQSHKDWPYQRWIELANLLIEKYNARIVFTGALEESFIVKEIISKIENKKKVIDTSGKLSIEQIASILKRADLLISLDSAMAHVCAQTNTPVIVLLGSDPLNCFPWTNKRIMLFHPEVCSGCRMLICPEGDNICMKTITVSEVLGAAAKFLK